MHLAHCIIKGQTEVLVSRFDSRMRATIDFCVKPVHIELFALEANKWDLQVAA